MTIKIKNSGSMNILLLFLEAQFYWAGKKLCQLANSGSDRSYRFLHFRLFEEKYFSQIETQSFPFVCQQNI